MVGKVEDFQEVVEMMVWMEQLKKRAERGHLLRVSEVARLLGVTRQHVYNMLKAGELPVACRLSIHGIRLCSVAMLDWSKKRMLGENAPTGDLGEGN